MLLVNALKEWAIAVDALTTGKTILLLRKGGIREQSFQIENNCFWLYPTYEHQKPELLKSEYASEVIPVESGWHPQTVEIKSYAKITDILAVEKKDTLARLLPYHVWQEQTIRDRFKWKPQQPLRVLLLRVFSLSHPHIIPYNSAYGGCKSWIDLVDPLSTENASEVLDDSRYLELSSEITNKTCQQ